MTTRSRNLIIVIVLLVLIGAGGALIYFFRGAPTLVGVTTDSNDQPVLPMITGYNPDAAVDISWADCRYVNFDPTSQSVWEVPFGNPLTIHWECTITDSSQARSLKVTDYTFRATAYELPADAGATTYEACLDQSDKATQAEWPKKPDNAAAFNWNTLQTWIAQHAGGTDCGSISGHSNIQELEYSNVNTYPVAVGQSTVEFDTTHNMDKCDWYQYDVVIEDAANPSASEGMGSFRRSFGPKEECGPGVPQADFGNLEVRMFFDKDGNKEYSTQAAGCTGSNCDTGYDNEPVELYSTTDPSVNVAQQYCNRATTGGAGRLSCFQLPIGQYRVKVSAPDTGLEGPVKDVGANPFGNEKHNENGVEDLTLTVIEAPAPTGNPQTDVVTYYDFGYVQGPITAAGSLLVRVYEEQTIDDEYSGAAEGAIFANRRVAITDDQGVLINAPNDPSCPSNTDAAGTLECTQLAPGDYTVDIDPDIKTHNGPEAEVHNPNGEDPYTVTVPVNPQVIADFQYLKRIVTPGFGCSLAADPDTGVRPLNTTLTATMDPAGTAIAKIDWVFGDGQTTTSIGNRNSITHTYQTVGSFTAVANVTVGATGEQVACQTVVQVTQVQPQGILCDLAANPTQGQAPLDTTLTTTVTPATTQVDSYVYDFGDTTPPQTVRTATIDHTYSTAGTFAAEVTVTSDTGLVATCNVDVEVTEIPTGDLCYIEVVDYLDLNRNLQQDPGIIGYIDPGMDGASVSIQGPAGSQSKITAQVGVNRYGEAAFADIPCGTYTVSIDETSQVTVGGTTQQYILNQLQRLTPAQPSTQVAVGGATDGVRVEFGYAPPIVDPDPLTCDIDKTVSDTTPADEGSPDDPKVTVSSQGETLTFTINWDCDVPTDPNVQLSFTLVDTPDPALTVIPTSITGGGVYNQSQGVITWVIQGANLDQGSVQFQATTPTNLAPGTYLYPNFVVALVGDRILDQDQTVTIVTVPNNGEQIPDIEVVKYAQDLNGGQVMPGDVLQYYVVVWNNGNMPLVATVTENIQPNVRNFDVITIPSGAVDSSTGPGTGSNGTGYLNVGNINLPNRGDVATITYQVTVNAGVPGGTQLVNFVTATAEGDSDTDDETVIVGQVHPNPPPPPPPGPGPLPGPTLSGIPGVSAGQVLPPVFGPRTPVGPPAGAPKPAPETGIASVMWILLLSLLAAFGVAGYFVIRQRTRSLEN